MTGPAATSAVRVAISTAAVGLGLADPAQLARELLDVDVAGLHEWFRVAAQVQVRLWQGAGLLTDCQPVLAAGWSSTAPPASVGRQRDAALAGRQIIGPQVDAADRAGAVLRQSRLLADSELSAADTAIIGLGWPPGTDLLLWAAGTDKLAAVTGVIVGLTDRLGEFRSRNNDALTELAAALHSDPRDPVQLLTLGAGAGAPGPAGTGPAVATPRLTAPPPSTALQANNLRRLQADLLSDNASTVAMAVGVSAALEQAQRDGGGAQLLVYESASSGGQGRAAIGVGDISTADNVAVMVPGITNAPSDMSGGIANAIALRTATAEQSPGDATAVVAWYGYDIPLSSMNGVPVGPLVAAGNTAAALDDDNARAGGDLLADDLAGFRQWAPSTARFVGIGFSMGATTVSAAAACGADFDDLVLMGSPGASTAVDSADDYPVVPAEHTYVAAFDDDPVTGTEVDVLAALTGNQFPPWDSPFGPDPASADFHAQVMDVDGTAPDLTSAPGMALGGLATGGLTETILDLAANHNEANYLSGSSLAAAAAVTAGRYSQVPIKPGR